MRALFSTLIGLSLLVFAPPLVVRAQDQKPRLALVIGIANYKEAPLATPVNDAGLVAQTLQEAGFDVTGAADLGEGDLRHALRDFVSKVRQAGPDAVVFVYLSGRGLQYAGENYFVPADALVQRETDVPVANVRLSDYTHALASLPAKARIFVFDGARALHFATEGNPFASGFAIVDAEPGSLYAFNAAPSTVAPDEPGPYGVYAQALVEMMREGTSVDRVFTDTRLRVDQLSEGTVVPWDVSKIDTPVFLFTREASAPPLQSAASPDDRQLSQLPVSEAYAVAVQRDTIEAYREFLAAYPRDPLALRVQALAAARREALTWRSALDANTPEAYWTYMRRYSHGPHFADARRRLAVLAAPLDPPPRFDPYDFGSLPPPPETDDAIVDQPVLIFNDPAFPPPPPVDLLPLRPVAFEHLSPPPPAAQPGLLPVPAPIPLEFSEPAKKPVALPNLGQGTESETPGEGGLAKPVENPVTPRAKLPASASEVNALETPVTPELAKPLPPQRPTFEKVKPPPGRKSKLKRTKPARSRNMEQRPTRSKHMAVKPRSVPKPPAKPRSPPRHKPGGHRP
jgi:uncharacterized caspase-like protein